MPPSSTQSTRIKIRLAPETRKLQIITEATRLISRSGFNAVSLNDIAEACGIRKSSVLHYFPTMNDLLISVINQRDLDEHATWALMTTEMDRDELRSHLRQVVERNLQMRQIVALFAVLNVESVDPRHPAHSFFVERTRLALQTLEGLLDWKSDPPTAARQLIAFWQGLETLWIAIPDTDFLRVWDTFCDDFFGSK